MTVLNLRRGGSSLASPRRGDNQNGVSRIDPWNDFTTMDRIFDNFFRNPFVTFDPRSGNGNSVLEQQQIELYETQDEVLAFLFAPGLDTNTLDISATADQITIRGERKPHFTPAEGTITHTPWSSLASSQTTLSASYSLPTEIDPEKITATYKDGVLEIKMAKHEATKPKQVKVQVAAPQS